jgi:hypothetical protein
MTLEEWKNDFKGFVNELSMPKDDYKGIMEYIDEVPNEIKWIPCSQRLPEEYEWIGTKTFGTTISDEVYVTFESPKGERFTKHLSFQNGKVNNFVQREIDAFYKGSVPIAWKPIPESYKGE